jgi:hypothetical protein
VENISINIFIQFGWFDTKTKYFPSATYSSRCVVVARGTRRGKLAVNDCDVPWPNYVKTAYMIFM